MSTPYLVALQGFSAFERSALGSYFRLAARREPAYEQVDTLAECQFVVTDADQPAAVAAVLQAGRVGESVFIGSHAPEGATAWMMRPIDPLHVLRELDAMVMLKSNERAPLVGLGNGSAPAIGRAAPRPAAAGPVPARRASDDGSGFVVLGDLRASSRSAQPAAATRGHEALLVDDSEIALRFLETRLQRQGLATQRAGTSGRALELLSQKSFDIVFLDVELGPASELDGLMLCQHIKRQHRPAGGGPPPVVVMVSAHHSELDRVRGMLAGCDAYIGKPLDVAALRGLLEQHGVLPAGAGSAVPAGG